MYLALKLTMIEALFNVALTIQQHLLNTKTEYALECTVHTTCPPKMFAESAYLAAE